MKSPTLSLALLAIVSSSVGAMAQVDGARTKHIPEPDFSSSSQHEEQDWAEIYKNLQSTVESNVTLSRMFDAHFKEWSSLNSDPSEIPDFPCQLTPPRSLSRPTSVHKLRPGDIDVVAALGDSISAGFGLDAKNIMELLTEWRGKSWSIGGDKSVEDRIFTLPNLIKRFNPNVKGFSVGKNLILTMNIRGNKEKSKYNVAISGAKSDGLISQAEMLVDRINSDPSVSLANDWKVITIFIGGNDLCAYCKRPEELSGSKYAQNVEGLLNYLRDNIPRALVNLALMMDVTQLAAMNIKSSCGLIHQVVCKCASHPASPQAKEELISETVEYAEVLLDLIATGHYDRGDDFTVVAQPFLVNQRLPRTTDGNPDFSYFAPDCFHFSAKGHASSAQALWNNMVEPAGLKRISWFPKSPWECLTNSQPYIYTYQNSERGATGADDGVDSEVAEEDGGLVKSNTEQSKSGETRDKWGATSSLPFILVAAVGAVCVVGIVAALVVKVLGKKRAKNQERQPLIG